MVGDCAGEFGGDGRIGLMQLGVRYCCVEALRSCDVVV